jgi:hypothetical protein
MGRTKVFLKDSVMDAIDTKHRTIHALHIETWYRCHHQRKMCGFCLLPAAMLPWLV